MPEISIEPELLDASLLQFEMDLCESLLRATPDHLEALALLGHNCTLAGLHGKALDVDRRLVALLPANPVCHYNLACSFANLGMIDEAFGELELSLDMGYDDLTFLQTDADLENLRGDPRFRQLIERLKSSAPRS